MTEKATESEVWAARLGDFLHDCAGSAAAEEVDRIREAILLLHDAVWDDARRGCSQIDPVAIEGMLASGAPVSAVLAMIGGETHFLLSRGAGGACLATMVLPDGSEEVICEGATLSLALLAAHVSMLLAGFDRSDDRVRRILPPTGARLH